MKKREVKIIKIKHDDAFFEDRHLFEGKIMIELGFYCFSFKNEEDAINAAKNLKDFNENGEYGNHFIFGHFEYEILKTGKRIKV